MLSVVVDDAMGGVPVSGSGGDGQIAAMNSFRMLRTNLNFLDVDDPPKTVLVTSALAEEGKTTVSIGLALAAAAGGRRVLLVEADLHRPVHAERLGIRTQPGIADYLGGEASPTDVLQTFEFVDPAASNIKGDGDGPQKSSLISITAGSRTPWPAELLGSERFADFLQKVRKAYDLVVIDSGPILGVPETSELIPQADSVIFCVRLGRTTTEQAEAGRDALARLPKRPSGLVVTDVSGRDRGYYAYAYSYGAERLESKS
jgi:capsular exopolysaccharide synthesis family protein